MTKINSCEIGEGWGSSGGVYAGHSFQMRLVEGPAFLSALGEPCIGRLVSFSMPFTCAL
jgi:hypothetical protein